MKGIGLQIAPITGGYDLETKVRRDEQGLITSGILIANATNQNQTIILMAQKGEVKEYPTTGVGLENILNDNEMDAWRAEIIDQMEQDGMKVEELELTDKELKLEAKYV